MGALPHPPLQMDNLQNLPLYYFYMIKIYVS